MLKARFVLCADTVINDKNTNAMSAVNIFENIIAPGWPFLIPRLAALALFEREGQDAASFEVEFRVTLGEERLMTHQVTVSFTENILLNHTTVNVIGLVLTKAGSLKIEFFESDRSLGSYLINVVSNPNIQINEPKS